MTRLEAYHSFLLILTQNSGKISLDHFLILSLSFIFFSIHACECGPLFISLRLTPILCGKYKEQEELLIFGACRPATLPLQIYWVPYSDCAILIRVRWLNPEYYCHSSLIGIHIAQSFLAISKATSVIQG